MENLVAFGGREYFAFLSVLLLSRGADFLSTWIATPNMVLEGNPIARKLGWRWGGMINLLVCSIFGMWPLAAIVIATTSLLVAARNFQSAWVMRALGEDGYREWYVDRILQTSLPLYLFCLAGQTLPTAAVGGVLMYFYDERLIPFAVGMGIVAYAVAVAVFTLFAVWKIHRAAG